MRVDDAALVMIVVIIAATQYYHPVTAANWRSPGGLFALAVMGAVAVGVARRAMGGTGHLP